MGKVIMLGKVAVERGGATQRTSESEFFKVPTDANNVGIIRHIDSSLETARIQVGAKVYFGPKHEAMFIEGKSLLVMDLSNIVAVEQPEN